MCVEDALVNCGLRRRAKRVRRWDGVGRDGSKRMVKGRSKRAKEMGKGRRGTGSVEMLLKHHGARRRAEERAGMPGGVWGLVFVL